jgi:hypothetical protein
MYCLLVYKDAQLKYIVDLAATTVTIPTLELYLSLLSFWRVCKEKR